MEDLFDTINQSTTKRTKKKSAVRDRLAGYRLEEAMGGEIFQGRNSDSSWFDLDHEIASRSVRRSESEELEFEPGALEELEEGLF